MRKLRFIPHSFFTVVSYVTEKKKRRKQKKNKGFSSHSSNGPGEFIYLILLKPAFIYQYFGLHASNSHTSKTQLTQVTERGIGWFELMLLKPSPIDPHKGTQFEFLN